MMLTPKCRIASTGRAFSFLTMGRENCGNQKKKEKENMHE